MDPILLLVLGAGVCVLGVVLFTFLGIKFRNEEWAFFLVIAVIVCAGAAGWCFQEAVKKAEQRPTNSRQ